MRMEISERFQLHKGKKPLRQEEGDKRGSGAGFGGGCRLKIFNQGGQGLGLQAIE